MKRILVASSILLAFFVVRSAQAGDQLSIAQLASEADAIAVVDNPLRSSVAIRRWLGGGEPQGPFTLSSPLCIPDKNMLLRWQKRHKTHPGAPTWERTLAVGRADQIVFFKLRKGMMVPLCETEIMLGQTFGTHPDFKATIEEVERLLREKQDIPPPARVAESPASSAPSASDPPAPPPAPVERAGKVWPFHDYVSAEAVVFNQFEIKPGVQFVAYNDQGWNRHIAKRQKISPAQMKAAVDLINDTKGGVVVSKCAFPRHAIVLFDADDVPIASINVCFQCGDILIWPHWTKPPHDWEKLENNMMRNAEVRMRRYDIAFPKWKKLFRDKLGFGPDIEKEWRPSPN